MEFWVSRKTVILFMLASLVFYLGVALWTGMIFSQRLPTLYSLIP